MQKKKKKKIEKRSSFLTEYHLKMLQSIASVKKSILIISSEWVNKQS